MYTKSDHIFDILLAEAVSAKKRVTQQDKKDIERRAKKNARLGDRIWVEVTRQPEKVRNGRWVGRATFYRQKDRDKKKHSMMINVGQQKATLSVRGKKLLVKPKGGKESYFYGEQEKKKKKEGESPDDFHERIGRCPRGYWWEDGGCTERETAKEMRRKRKKTGNPKVDQKLEKALTVSNPVKDEAGEIKVKSAKTFKDLTVKEFSINGREAKQSLSKDEVERIEDYSIEVSGYDDINRGYKVMNAWLRGGDKAGQKAAGGYAISYSGKKAKENAKRLSAAINKGSMTRDTNVYRGANDKKLRALYENLSPGEEVKSAGFWSSSASKKMANSYAGRGGRESAVIFKIQLPKGAKALNVSEMSGFKEEQEILLNANSKFRLAKKKKTKGALEVTLEYIGDGGVK
jgi:hypothetical protein